MTMLALCTGDQKVTKNYRMAEWKLKKATDYNSPTNNKTNIPVPDFNERLSSSLGTFPEKNGKMWEF